MMFQLQYHSGNKCIHAYKYEKTIGASECPANLFVKPSIVLVKNFKSQVNYVDGSYEKLHSTIEGLLYNTEVVPLQPVLQVLQKIKCEMGEDVMHPSYTATRT